MLRGNLYKTQFVLLLFALTNAVLYSCGLPLWEGFDEPFHYAYVQSLALQHRFPVLNQTRISSEIRQSLSLAPVSPILHRTLPRSISFAEWFQLSSDERLSKNKALSSLSPGLRLEPSESKNYEAQQAPLAYVLLVPVNVAMSSLPLRRRILVLRLFAAGSSTLLLFFASQILATTLELQERFRLVAQACIFESQMLWASIAHVGNDWLSIPLATALIAYFARVSRYYRNRDLIITGILLGAGLLTKAYFLAFVPVFGALLLYGALRSHVALRSLVLPAVVPVVIATPWYVRNVVLYGSISGMQETARGIGLPQALGAVTHINWLRSFAELSRSSLWTGNWSFTAFSRSTLNCELLLIAAGLVLLFIRHRQITRVELFTLAALGSFGLALAYYTCLAWADTNGVATSPQPWYPQCIMPAIWMLVFLGFERNSMLGCILTLITSLVAAWIAALTYVGKLFPLYGGYEGRATVPALWKWWSNNPGALLSTVTLIQPALLFGLLFAFLALLLAVNTMLLKRFV
jgi:hypothetical protein